MPLAGKRWTYESMMKRRKGKKRTLNQTIKTAINRRMEKKHVTTTASGTLVDATGDIIAVSGVAQATTAQTDILRVGDNICPYSLEARLNFRRNSANGGDIIRVIFFKWKGDDGDNAPTVADILGSTATVEHPLAHDSKALYVILSDHVLRLGNSDSSLNRVQYRKEFYSKKLGEKISFDGGAVTGINQLYMLILGDRANPDDSSVDYNVRLYFTDA